MQNANQLLNAIEQQRLWHHFHKDWLVQIRSLLRPQLPAEYSLFVESETVIVAPDAPVDGASLQPDVGVTRDLPEPIEGQHFENVTAAVAEAEESCELQTQYTLVIRRSPHQRLVAAIELLSPTNKGTYGRLDLDKYLRKRDLYLEAGVNLLEIDSLLEGEALWPKLLPELLRYQRRTWATLHADGRRHFTGWGWNEADRLPRLVWSVESERRVLVDLAESFQQAAEFNNWETLVRR